MIFTQKQASIFSVMHPQARWIFGAWFMAMALETENNWMVLDGFSTKHRCLT